MAGQILITASGGVVLGAGGGAAVGPAAALSVPGTISNLAIGPVTSSSVALTWNAPTTGTQPFTGYSVIYSTSSSGPWTTFGTVSTPSVTVTGLAGSTGYYFSIAGINGVGTGLYVTSQAITTLAVVSGATITTLQVRNGAATAMTAPAVQAGHAFAPGDVPAGSYPDIRITGTGTSVANYQWDQISTRKDGSWYYAVASFKADGSFAAYKTSGDTHAYDLVVTSGTPPYTTSSITPTTIAAASQLYVKLYGADFTAEAGAGDYYFADFNYILANYPRDAWGTNPTGGWELVSSGRVCNKYWGWMCARRHSDNAIHKWLVVAFEVTVWASGQYTINPVVLQPWIYGAHPSGTLGPAATAQPNVSAYVSVAQPRYAGFYELWDLKSNTLIGARGGPNDARNFSIPAANFELNTMWIQAPASVLGYPGALPGGGITQSTGWMLSAASGGTLPGGIDPNWVYWSGCPSSSRFYLQLERCEVTSSASYSATPGPDTWRANTAISAGTWVGFGTVGFYYLTSGTTGSTGPTFNPIGSGINPVRTDGTATYIQAGAKFTSQGSGNVIFTPVCATFGNTAIDFKDELGQPYWFDPVNHSAAPWSLPMMDFNYATKSSKVVHPFEFHTPMPVPDGDPGIRGLLAVERYFPNDIFADFGQGTWDVMRAPGDDILDNRLGAWNQRQALRLYQPGDRNTAQNARVMAARFFNFHHWGWDHRTGRIPLINLGHDHAGGAYTGYPAGTINSTLTWYTHPSSNVGSPTPMGVGYDTNLTPFVFRHIAGYTSTYGQVVNGSHCPNPSMGDRVINGDYVALQEMQMIHFGCLAYQFGSSRNSPTGFSGLGGLVCHDFGQARANGWDTVKQCTTMIFTPDWHLMKPYYKDNVTDQSAYFAGLKTYMDAAHSPNMSAWGLTSLTVATIGGITTLWGLSHQMEGMAYGAMSLTPDYPGFKIATDTYVKNLARIWDPANGGCLYYVGLDFVCYGTAIDDPSTIPSTFAGLATQPNIDKDPSVPGNYNLYAQTPGGSFVCPGIGQSAPVPLQTDTGGTSTWWSPGVNILDGGKLWGGQPFCAGNIRVDAAAIPIQIIAPVAVAANMPGADPSYSTLWHAARTRMTQGGMNGPTFAGVYAPAGTGSYGSFQYCYSPPT